MKMISAIVCGLAVATAVSSTSCQSQKPGEYSKVKSLRYNFAGVPAAEAWQKAYDLLSKKAEILADDGTNLTLRVKQFDTEALVRFEAVTPRSCRYIVTARNGWMYPAEDTCNNIYNELDRLFEGTR